jgi:hypothetical protein
MEESAQRPPLSDQYREKWFFARSCGAFTTKMAVIELSFI